MDLVALLGLGLILTTVAANDLNDAVRRNTDSLKLLVDRLDRLTIDFYSLESKLNVKMQTMFDEVKSAIKSMQVLPIGASHAPELKSNMKSIIEESVQKQAVIVYKAFEAEKRQLRKLKSDIQSDIVIFKSTTDDRFKAINESLGRYVQLSEEIRKEMEGCLGPKGLRNVDERYNTGSEIDVQNQHCPDNQVPYPKEKIKCENGTWSKKIECYEVVEYSIEIKTSERLGAGTDGMVYLNFFGKDDRNTGQIYDHADNGTKYDSRELDSLIVRRINVGKVSKLQLGVEKKHKYYDGWIPSYVRVVKKTPAGSEAYVFLHDESEIDDTYVTLEPTVYCTRPSNNNNGVSDKQYYRSGDKIKCLPDFQPATESVCQDGRWSQEPRCETTLCLPPTGPGHDQKQQYKDGEHFECARDYELQGDSMCSKGRWSQAPICVYIKMRYRIRFKLPDNMRADDDPDHSLSIELVGKNGHKDTLQLQIDFRSQINENYKDATDIGTIGRIEVSGISRVPDFISITNADRNEYYIFRPVQEGFMISNQSITLYPEGGQCSFQANNQYPLFISGTYDWVETASQTDCNFLCMENKSCVWTFYSNGFKPCFHFKSNSRRTKGENTMYMYLKICQILTF